MNCFYIILFYLFVRARCETLFQNGRNIGASSAGLQINLGPDILASVREYPSLLHKCTATFITPDILVTTAKCLYCDNCHLFLHALSNHLTDDTEDPKAVSYNITKTAIYPKYEVDPHKNDIGLIKLEKNVTGAVLFGLSKSLYDSPGSDVQTYRWKFTSNYREYHLENQTETVISNAMCSLLLSRYVDCKSICTRRENPFTRGPFDQGTPLLTNGTKGGVILGLYNKEGSRQPSKFEVYDSIYPYVEWIQEIIKCDFKCTPPVSSPDKVHEIIITPTNTSTTTTTTTTTPPPSFPPTLGDTQSGSAAPLYEPDKQQPEPKGKEQNLVKDNEKGHAGALEPGKGNSQRKAKPVKWTADFPFSEQKKMPFQPTNFPM